MTGHQKNYSPVCVCILACGQNTYLDAAKRTVNSVLNNSNFDIFLASDKVQHFSEYLGTERVSIFPLNQPPLQHQRADSFLRKFELLTTCLENHPGEWVIMIDADALFVRIITEDDIINCLENYGMAMVEQKTIMGSDMCRQDFLNHYLQNTMVWFDDPTNISLSSFHYYNSGLVLMQKLELKYFLSWENSILTSTEKLHHIGREMIADQDYFQYWANTLSPGSCNCLPWYWNHCEHWDTEFPKPDARIVHLSNFCNGPTVETIQRMDQLQSHYFEIHKKGLS